MKFRLPHASLGMPSLVASPCRSGVGRYEGIIAPVRCDEDLRLVEKRLLDGRADGAELKA